MKIVEQVEGLRETIAGYRQAGLSVGFVPTMGNLHAGHLALVDAAQDICDKVVVSIFVNPMQFSADEDYDTYPVTQSEDEQALIEHKTSLLYRPQSQDIYPSGLNNQTRVEVPELSDTLCGLSRPHFFTGVATVVNTLFNQVQPDMAFFGKKDYQQYLVIKRMVTDLAMNLKVIGVETVRLQSGLAMSSRNSYLSAGEQIQAAGLYQLLQKIEQGYRQDAKNVEMILEQGIEQLSRAGFKPDYLSIRRQNDLKEPNATDVKLVVLVAAWLGKARLIDNLEFDI